MATGRVVRVRSAAADPTATPVGRLVRVRSKATGTSRGRVAAVRSKAVSGFTGRVVNVRSVATTTAPFNGTVQPFDIVNLGPGAWVQTSGPTVTVPVFRAPGRQYAATLTFTSGGDTATVTVRPHTMFRLTSAGLVASETITLGVDTASPAPLFATATGAGTGTATLAAASAMHIGDLGPNWQQVSAVDFSTIPDFPIGTLTSNDGQNSRLTSTDAASLALRDKVRFYQAGHPDTSQVGVYDPARFSNVNGLLTLNMAVINGVPTGGHFHPVVAGQESTSGAWRLPTPGLRYRIMARFNGTDPHWGGVTFGISNVKAEDDWSEGSAASANIQGFFHNAVSGQHAVPTVPGMSRHDLHLYDTIRIPATAASPSVTYLVDDYQAYQNTNAAEIGSDTMSVHFQACTDGTAPAAGTTGTIEIAYIEVYQYVP